MIQRAVFPHVQIDIRVAAHIAFFEISLCHFDVTEDLLHGLHKEGRFFGTGHIGLRYDFDERSSAAVVVDIRMRTFKVQRFTDIFFEVNALDPYAAVSIVDDTVFAFEIHRTAFRSAGALVFRIMDKGQIDVPVGAQRNIVLRNLVALCQIGIKIMLAVEFRKARDAAVERLPRNGAEFDVAFAYARHRTGKSETHGTHARIGHTAVAVFARAKRFCLC